MAGTGQLERTLQNVRSRLLRQALLLSMAHALCAVLLLAATVRVSAAAVPLYSFFLVFIGVFALLGALRLRRLPGLPEIARRADCRFGLDERLSAAFEAGRSGRQGTTMELLQRDAAAHLTSVDPVLLAPVWPGRPAWSALAAASLLTAAVFLLPPATEVEQHRAAGQPSGDPVAGQPPDAASALPADSELLSVLAPTVQDLTELAEAADPAAPEIGEPLAGEEPGSPRDTADADNPATASAERSATDRSGSQPAESGGEDGQLALADTGDFDGSETSRQFMEPDPNLLRRLEERRQQMLSETAGMEVASLDSAAQQSDRGAGDPGGDGPESGGGLAGSDVEFGFDGSTLDLSQQELRDGERSTTRASPDAQPTGDPADAGGTFSGFVRTAETPQQQPVSSTRYLQAVRDYFLPDVSE